MKVAPFLLFLCLLLASIMVAPSGCSSAHAKPHTTQATLKSSLGR